MVFQEPMTSLNPVLTIGLQLTETLQHHLRVTSEKATARAVELLGMVGISDAERRLKQYPHHFSGGMRQRVMIALALSCEPKLIIADEPTTALDVTIQAQILELMKDLTKRLRVALIVITHNLGVVARYADRVNVMYAGKIVEEGSAAQIYHHSRHPYTIGLLSSVPRMDRHRGQRLVPIHARAVELLGMVGISDAERRLKQYPHHFSGGMRQRVMIALALSCEPKLIIADEPTTALDVTIQAQILELMKDLTKRLRVALIVITHNLGVVARYADRVNVMYAGKIVEEGTAAQVYHNPRHPYTIGLLSSVPRILRISARAKRCRDS